jgi:choline-phosphate cytidylyltransferase
VCHDALPYVDTSGTAASGDVYSHIKSLGKFWETQRTDVGRGGVTFGVQRVMSRLCPCDWQGVSTSDLIIRIVKDYDKFVRRNLKRGHTGKEMNVPFIKEKVIRLDMAVDDNKEKLKKFLAEVCPLLCCAVGRSVGFTVSRVSPLLSLSLRTCRQRRRRKSYNATF